MKKQLILIILLTVLLSACSTAPRKDLHKAQLNSSLIALEQDEQLKGYLDAQKLNEAREAVIHAASATRTDVKGHRQYLAEKKIELARFSAQGAWAEDQVIVLERAREKLLVKIKTLEAEQARKEAEQALLISQARAEEAERALATARQAQAARAQADEAARKAREEAEQANRLANASVKAAELARQEIALTTEAMRDLEKQLENFKARETDRGLVVTLGDVLFASSEATLATGTEKNIEQLLSFLQEHPGRKIRVEGHTDSRGSVEFNQTLSQQRAETIASALVQSGIESSRIQAVGYGESRPVETNQTESGRQANRRVEVVVLKAQ